MGLLDKTLKKSGKEREKPAPQPASPVATAEKPAVNWLSRSFSERTKALADKIDLESQYARLEQLTKTADLTPPPKTSLRERAKRFLSGLTPGRPSAKSDATPADTRPKLSLRERAAQLIKKMGGGSGGTGGSPAEGGQETGVADAGKHRLDSEEHIDEADFFTPTYFPWHSLTEEGGLSAEGLFGEGSEHLPPAQEMAQPVEKVAEEAKTPLAEFADTIGRITDNLRNLHVQLDTGNFIRDVPTDRTAAPAAAGGATTSAAAPTIISHHVPDTTVPAGAVPAKEEARDIFWPKEMPLDLPARDIKLNADGTISVVPGPFQLPYLAQDIAAPDSELSHFTRNLQNAELFIAEGELQLTRIIYERLLIKIVDEEARRKIRANLEALDKYRKSHDWGNFMPVPPWNQPRNPWADVKPPQLNISEMPVEAKNITINLDKGFFEIARAFFEQEKKAKEKAAGEGEGDEAGEEEGGAEGELPGEEEGQQAQEEGERRKGEDRRKGGADARGDGAPDRRKGARRADEGEEDSGESGAGEDAGEGAGDEGAGEKRSEDKRSETPPNTAPPPLAADGASAEEEEKPGDGVMEPPKIPEMSPDGQAMSGAGADEEGGSGEEKEEENKVQEIRGVLELKTPDQEDTPFLTLTYDFTKIPHAYRLAKDNGIFEYAYYKYKPMLVKAHQFIKRKQITRALNYYRVIREQQIPSEFRHMVDRNIKDITEYLQKYLVTRAN